MSCILEPNPDYFEDTLPGSSAAAEVGTNGSEASDGDTTGWDADDDASTSIADATSGPATDTGADPGTGDCLLFDGFDGPELGSWWLATGNGTVTLDAGAAVLEAPLDERAELHASLSTLDGFDLRFDVRELPAGPEPLLRIGAVGATTLFLTVSRDGVTATAQTPNSSRNASAEGGPFDVFRLSTANGVATWEVSADDEPFRVVGSFDSLELDGFFSLAIELNGGSMGVTQASIDEVSVCPL